MIKIDSSYEVSIIESIYLNNFDTDDGSKLQLIKLLTLSLIVWIQFILKKILDAKDYSPNDWNLLIN